jgi:hypothetical protein
MGCRARAFAETHDYLAEEPKITQMKEEMRRQDAKMRILFVSSWRLGVLAAHCVSNLRSP